MNNFKKIGLTALAGSLVAVSAFAGSVSNWWCFNLAKTQKKKMLHW